MEARFPRYIFIRVGTRESSTALIHSTRGVVGLVRLGSTPAVVANYVMDVLFQPEVNDFGCIRIMRLNFARAS